MGGRCGSRPIRHGSSGQRPRARGPGADDQAQYRVLIYSHDSFGLGHLRRCRTIAHSLVAHHKKLNVLILSGSPILGRFSFRSRVDFVRVPGIIKRRNGEYTSLNLDFHVEQTLALRASIIEHTARVFRPASLPGRQGAARAARRGAEHARAAAPPGGNAARPRASRHHGRPDVARRGVAAQARDPGAQALLRPDLGLRAAAGLRSDRGLRVPRRGRRQDDLHGLSPARDEPRGHPARRRPGHGPAGPLPPGDARGRRATAPSWSTRRSAPTSGSTAGCRGRRSSCTGRSCRRGSARRSSGARRGSRASPRSSSTSTSRTSSRRRRPWCASAATTRSARSCRSRSGA